MNDLLNEDEFLPKEYNPKKWFVIFYIASALITAFLYNIESIFSFGTTDSIQIVIGTTAIVTPIILSMIMILSKRDNRVKLSKKRMISTIGALTGSAYLAVVITVLTYNFIHNKTSFELVALSGFLLIYAIIYGITLAIIIPIINRYRKTNKTP